VEEVYAREFEADGARFSAIELESALHRAWADVRASSLPDRYGGTSGEPEFWRAFLGRVRGRLDGWPVSAEAFERLAKHFRDPESWAIFDDVLPTLDRLSAGGLRLAVVSNWDSHLPRLLSDLGLSSRFGAVLVSAVEETGKPDPEIFRRACARLTVEPGEALHVGDSPREDYEGAIGAGLSALLLDRAGRHEGAPNRVRRLTEVADRLSL
jgi:putative hydrolase of the HAD superfamily